MKQTVQITVAVFVNGYSKRSMVELLEKQCSVTFFVNILFNLLFIAKFHFPDFRTKI
jgi:hypothetical protein